MGAGMAVTWDAWEWESRSGQVTGGPGAGVALRLWTLPAEGMPGRLLDDIFHVSSRFLPFSKPFCLGSLALRHDTQHPPHRK